VYDFARGGIRLPSIGVVLVRRKDFIRFCLSASELRLGGSFLPELFVMGDGSEDRLRLMVFSPRVGGLVMPSVLLVRRGLVARRLGLVRSDSSLLATPPPPRCGSREAEGGSGSQTVGGSPT